MTRKEQPVLVSVSWSIRESLGGRSDDPRFEVGGLDRKDLEFIRDALNFEESLVRLVNPAPLKKLQKELQSLVTLWQTSGPDLEAMMRANPEVREGVEKACVTTWMPTSTGRANLSFSPTPPEPLWFDATRLRLLSTKSLAFVLFHLLTLNPECEKLAGPCARCGRYYFKKRVSQTVYCSRRCGNTATAVIRTRKKLDEEHKDKLKRAKTAAREWIKAPTGLDWKRWVSRKEPDISPKFLTRAVNKHELEAPTKARK